MYVTVAIELFKLNISVPILEMEIFKIISHEMRLVDETQKALYNM